jgi:uncharacterized protein YqhQ
MSDNHRSIKFDPNNPLQVGGQAVIEGVMMRAPGRIATAVRRSNGQIIVKKKEYQSLGERYKMFKLPLLRGAVGLIEMMFIGIETLNFSAEVALHDAEEAERAKGNGKAAAPKKQLSNAKFVLTVMFSLVVGIAIFFITPLVVTTSLFDVEQQPLLFNLTSGAIRITILIGYLVAISFMKDVKRLFEYHGAEHKAVFTFESQADLAAEVAKQFTRFHPRCGTSFVLIVMLVSVLFFALVDTFLILWLGELSLFVRLLTHVPLIPFIGGVSYEFIRWSAKRRTTAIGKILVAPGLWLQRITTNEPTLDEIEVAVVALKCALGVEEFENVTFVEHAAELAG